MPTLADLRADLDDVSTLKLISSAFTEAAAARIQKIKKEFETNHEFYEEISWLYHLVQVNAKRGKKTGGGKTISVAVTSNQRFYGNINVSVMTEFLKKTKGVDTKLLVLGSTGKDFMHSSGKERAYDVQSFVKDNPSKEEVREFLTKVKDYDSVLVYYPRFVSLVRQEVGLVDITHTADIGKPVPEDEAYILFEPELTKILQFFEQQIRSLLFLRVVLESDLARTAARLITMSSAEERSTEMVKTLKRDLRKIQNMITNAKLLETFSAMKGAKHS